MFSNLLWFSSPCLSLFLSHFVPPPLLFLVYSKVFLCLYVSPLNPYFFSFIFWPLYPQMERRKFPFLFRIPFLFGYCKPDLRQEMCEFKDLYFWRNYRKSNLLSNDTNLVIFGSLNLVIFGSLRLEIWVIIQDSIWSAGSIGLIQSLFFDSLFGLRNTTTEFYALHMFCRPSSQIFKNGDECLELSCIAFFAAQNQSMFGFTAEFYLLSNLVSENTLISYEVNSSKRDPKF